MYHLINKNDKKSFWRYKVRNTVMSNGKNIPQHDFLIIQIFFKIKFKELHIFYKIKFIFDDNSVALNA